MKARIFRSETARPATVEDLKVSWEFELEGTDIDNIKRRAIREATKLGYMDELDKEALKSGWTRRLNGIHYRQFNWSVAGIYIQVLPEVETKVAEVEVEVETKVAEVEVETKVITKSQIETITGITEIEDRAISRINEVVKEKSSDLQYHHIVAIALKKVDAGKYNSGRTLRFTKPQAEKIIAELQQ